MATGWIVEVIPASASDDPSIRRYGVRCADRSKAKDLVMAHAGADDATKMFVLRPMSDDELQQHKLSEDEVGDWAGPDAEGDARS